MLNNIRRPSIEAAGNGGGTSLTAAHCTTSAPRRRGTAKQATTCREGMDLLRSFQNLGQPLGQAQASKGGLAKLDYFNIKLLIDRRIIKNKRGYLSEQEIQTMVKDWHNRRAEGELCQETIEMETRAMEKKLRRYNVEQLGEIPKEREDGMMRILVCQLGGCASTEVRELKIAAMEKLIWKYDINLCLFMELNYNWSKVNSSANLSSWF